MQCRTCGSKLIEKSRLKLLVVGCAMVALIAIDFEIRYFWIPGIVLFLTGVYLIVWATVGKGRWCRTCKTFSL